MALNITRPSEAKPKQQPSNGVSSQSAVSQERETAIIDTTPIQAIAAPVALAPVAPAEAPEARNGATPEDDATHKPRRSRSRRSPRKTTEVDGAAPETSENDAPQPEAAVESPVAESVEGGPDTDPEPAPRKPATRRRGSRSRAAADPEGEAAPQPEAEAVPAVPVAASAGLTGAIDAQSRLIERQIAIAERQLKQLELISNRLDRQNQQLDQQSRKLDAEGKQLEKLSASVEASLRRAGEALSETRPKVGVFVDVANVELAADRFRDRLDWKKVLAMLTKDRELVRAVAYAPVHGDLDVSIESQRFVEPFLDSDFKIITKPLKKFQDGTVKANVDIEMAVDILGMLDRLDVVCLVSGDGDFKPLVDVCQGRGIRVEVVGIGPTVARTLRDAADRFIDLQERLRDLRK